MTMENLLVEWVDLYLRGAVTSRASMVGFSARCQDTVDR